MIVIVEGIDRIGKTTFCNKVAGDKDLNFIYLKDAWNYNDAVASTKDYSIGKLDTSISFLTLLNDQGKHVVVDRLHLTELVYGALVRGETNFDAIMRVDNALARLDARLILFEPNNLAASNKEAGMDMSQMVNMFKAAFDGLTAIKYKWKANYTSIDYMVNIVKSNLKEWELKHGSQGN